MNDNISLRRLAGWIAMIVGTLLGWWLAGLAWRSTHFHGITIGGLPPRPLEFVVIRAKFSLSGAPLGLALARFRDLPE